MSKYDIPAIRAMAEYITGQNFWCAAGMRFADGPAGLRVQKGSGDSMGLNKSMPATCFPSHTALACSWNRQLTQTVAEAMGREAIAYGVDVLLAPAINIKRSPYNGRNFEYFSEDAYLSGELGTSFVNGVQSTGVGACVKHFAANNKELGRSVADSQVTERTLYELYFPAFEAVVQNAHPVAIMTSYNKLNGVYCNHNKWLLTQVLREQWGFQGFVVSDWGGSYDRVLAVKAGADLEMPAFPRSAEELVKAYESGKISGEEIEACANRLKEASARKKPPKTQYSTQKHAKIAFDAACESHILLKNENALPLNTGARVAVFGGAAKDAPVQGGGSSHVMHGKKVESLLSALKENFTVTGFVGGYKKLNSKGRKLIEKADAVIVCLAAYEGDHEGKDKDKLTLPENQLKLIKSLYGCGKKVICLLVSGGAIDTSWDDCVNALLYLPLAGEGAFSAAAQILCGKINPSGRLAESFFNNPDELPSTKQFNKSQYYTQYAEGCAVGYRHYLAAGLSPKYAFGHGLCYTRFTFLKPCATPSGVELTVTNSGEQAGAEVVQIYLEFPSAANAISPVLVGFEKVFLKAGESKKINIPFTRKTFRSYDISAHKWVTVSGEYSIHIAKSSQNFVFTLPIYIEGDSLGAPADTIFFSAPAEYPITRNKRGRVIAEFSTPFCELQNSKALLVRLMVKCALHFTRKNPTVSGTMRYTTLGSVANMAAFNLRQTEGLLNIFNGQYLRGIYKLLTKNKRKKPPYRG